PTRNYQDNASPNDSKLNLLSEKLWNNTKKYKVKRHACYGCQIGCHKVVEMDGIEIGEIEYETVGAFGGRCALDDFEPICKCNYYCSIYGMDTISTGTIVGMAMECYERGIITKDDLDGLDLHFGNGEAAAELIKKMALREGCGDIWADGCDVAAEKIGGDAKKYAMTCKGLELSASDPRASTGMVVSFGTSERGACHMRPYAATCDALGYNFEDIGIMDVPDPVDDTADKTWVKSLKEIFVSTNLVGICDFDVINCELKATTLAQVYSAATGRTIDREELLKAAERCIALERAINYERGFRREDDKLPERFSKEPATYGDAKGRTIDNEAALDGYYKACDYDPELAIPTMAKFEELGLAEIGKRVYA
ncbi:MAG: aldehyde ferredoxin oxidoreductase C-terminal domain-containing protein, partial [Coriobacteriales bacterium]|nr:aldehyde ferredoxin oxidoreductase C-terminal domain-containing protein [Coriobacteriales bacterium]